jgi:hypothetical protein
VIGGQNFRSVGIPPQPIYQIGTQPQQPIVSSLFDRFIVMTIDELSIMLNRSEVIVFQWYQCRMLNQ